MGMILIYFLLGLLLLIEFFLLIFLIFSAIFWLVTKMPAVATRKRVIQWLQEELKNEKGKNFYDLGSGDGSLVYFLAKQNPQLKFFGYEINPFYYLFAKIFHHRPNLFFFCKNFFKVNLKEADYLYLYLNPLALEKLYPKLKKELRPGTIVISNSFAFKELKPQKVLSSGKILETLYFYQF